MEENDKKNIVLIIGNGFDLDLGLKTSYKDFWESEFCPKLYPAPIIRHLNSQWERSLEAVKWYDLENELLHYDEINSSNLKRRDILSDEEMEFLRKFDNYRYACHQYNDKVDIINGLISKGYAVISNPLLFSLEIPYLEDYKLSIRDRDHKALELIKQGLCQYLQTTSKQQPRKNSIALSVIYALTEAAESGNNMYVYNFNYTELPYPYCDYDNLFYLHGRCKDDKIIVGTKDNKELSKDYEFLQKSFDPNFKTPPVVSDLLHADEVIFFGHSLGMNDSQYFKPFFVQQTNVERPTRKAITIFTKDAKSKVEIKRSLQQMTGYNLSLLNSLNDFEIIETDNIRTNSHSFRDFLKRFIVDDNAIRAQLRQL